MNSGRAGSLRRFNEAFKYSSVLVFKFPFNNLAIFRKTLIGGKMRIVRSLPLLFVFLVFGLTSCSGVSVNKSIEIGDGETVRKNLTSVNGNITIGDDCKILGDCSTVNGSIRIGRNSKVDQVKSVNGSIEVGENSMTNRDVKSVNGHITCKSGVKISGEINSINGSVEIDNTEVARDIVGVNGDIHIDNKSIVRGDVLIKTRHGSDKNRVKIYIRGNSIVDGGVIAEGDANVEVHLENGSEIRGPVRDVELIEE